MDKPLCVCVTVADSKGNRMFSPCDEFATREDMLCDECREHGGHNTNRPDEVGRKYEIHIPVRATRSRA